MRTPRGRPRRDTIHLLRAALLFGFAALIAKLFIAGEMVKYMAPALDPLTALTGVVVAAMGVIEVGAGSRHAHADERRVDAIEQILTYVLVVLPLGLGILVTPRALGAGALGGESVASLLLAYAPGPAPPPGAGPAAPFTPIADTTDLLTYLQRAGMSGVGQRVRATGLALRSGRSASVSSPCSATRSPTAWPMPGPSRSSWSRGVIRSRRISGSKWRACWACASGRGTVW